MSFVTLPSGAEGRLKDARLAANVEQAALAEKSGVSVKVIRRLERSDGGTYQESTIVRICGALGATIRDLLKTDETGQTTVDSLLSLPDALPESVDVFFSTPMMAFGDQYETQRTELLSLVQVLRSNLGVTVFWAAEERPDRSRFEDEALALRMNLALLRRSRIVVAIYPAPLNSSVLVELGFALAFETPVLLFVHAWDDLPFLLRSAGQAVPHFRVSRYRDAHDVKEAVTEEYRSFILACTCGSAPQPVAGNSPAPTATHDSASQLP